MAIYIVLGCLAFVLPFVAGLLWNRWKIDRKNALIYFGLVLAFTFGGVIVMFLAHAAATSLGQAIGPYGIEEETLFEVKASAVIDKKQYVALRKWGNDSDRQVRFYRLETPFKDGRAPECLMRFKSEKSLKLKTGQVSSERRGRGRDLVRGFSSHSRLRRQG